FSRDWSSDVCSSDLSAEERVGGIVVRASGPKAPLQQRRLEAIALIPLRQVRRFHNAVHAKDSQQRVYNFIVCVFIEAFWIIRVEIGRASCREREWVG